MIIEIRLIILSLLLLLYEASSTRREKRISKCTECPPGWGVFKKCTLYENTLCKPCEYGKSYSPHHSTKSPCFLCSRCGVGLYEIHRCTPTRDTVCDECIAIIGRTNFTRRNDFGRKCSYLFFENHHNHS